MTVVYITKTAEQTLDVIQAYKAAKMPLEEAQDFTDDLLERALDAVETNPARYPPDPGALQMGVTLQRWLDVDSQYLCLYRYFPKEDIALMDIFASTRQNYLSLLYIAQLSRP